jgi:hypothetical protein
MSGWAAVSFIAAESRVRNAASAGTVATGCTSMRIEPLAATSSIQSGTSWMRAGATPGTLHRANGIVPRSITSWMRTTRLAQGCQR